MSRATSSRPGGIWALLGLAAWWLGLFVWAAPSLQSQPIVKQIVITNRGPVTVGESLVRANIRSKVGDPYNGNVIDDDVRSLYATGFFSNVQVAEEQETDGMILYYFLQGKLKITDIIFIGNEKYKTRKLRKKLTIEVGEPLDERKLFNDRQEMIKLYQKSGYPDTTVETRIEPNEGLGTARVVFEIQESLKVKITDIVFDGAEAFTQRELRKAIETKRRWFLSWLTGSGVLKKDQLQIDREKLQEFYYAKGYIDYELKDIEYEYLTPRKMVLHFVISEGRQYKVGAIAFKGFTLFSTNAALEKLEMTVGETFTMAGLNKDQEAIRDLFGARGYIDTFILARRLPNTRTGTMDLMYEVEEGDQSYIEKVEIRGNIKTKDRVLRRELAVSPGEVFDMTRVKLSQRRLEGLGYFESVYTQPEPTEVPDRRDLVITVTEQTTGHFNIGAGFSSVDSLIGFVELTQGNFDLANPPWFMGGGQKMRLRLTLGTRRQDYVATFIEPWFLGKKLELSVEAYHRELNFVSPNDLYDQQETGGRVGLTKALGSEELRGGISYGLKDVNLDLDRDLEELFMDDPNLENIFEDGMVSYFGALLAYDTRNHSLMPDDGGRIELAGTLAGGPFGGDIDFYRVELRGSQYIKGFAEGHIIELLARGGYVDSFGSTDTTPIFERFFLGGLDSLRGYKYRTVGPTEPGEEEPIGGNYYWYGSAEYSIPIIDRVRFAAFYDIGMAYSFDTQYNIGNYNDNWGVGIRLNLPIGPLRLDYGIPINDSDGINDSSGRFQFSAGYTRDF